MKKLVLTLIMLAAVGFSQAQTIGDQLNTVREEKPNGKVDLESKPYSYSVVEKDVSSLMIYFFNDDLTCFKIAIVPQTSFSRQRWVISFNTNWVTVDSTHWKLYRGDNVILVAYVDYIESVGTLFMIEEEKSFN